MDDTTGQRPKLSSANFAKLCRDCGIIQAWQGVANQGEEVSRADIDLVFSRLLSASGGKKGPRGLGFAQFEGALEVLSLRKFPEMEPDEAYAEICSMVLVRYLSQTAAVCLVSSV